MDKSGARREGKGGNPSIGHREWMIGLEKRGFMQKRCIIRERNPQRQGLDLREDIGSEIPTSPAQGIVLQFHQGHER
jgi:hypothetical protein